MTTYGVTPAGFVRKPLAAILDDLEARAASPDVFGAGVIQTPESPLGLLNAHLASIAATAWEIAEATYQSFDPNQAEGARLDMLAKLRILARADGEQDVTLRADMLNAGRANIDISDLVRAVRGVADVIWSQVWVNDGAYLDTNGQEPHSICIAALGGADDALAAIFRSYVAPGISSHGNSPIQTVVDGFCQTFRLMRPTELRIGLSMQIRAYVDRNGCSPPSNAQIAQTLAAFFASADRPANGADITLPLLNQVIARLFANIEIVAAHVTYQDVSYPLPYVIAFDQIASVGFDNIALSRS
ncbi:MULTISPECIES: hypothetical protein [unclassified Beijerinckia]|uniref:hypothetical protein n=1 Tax=unclassified Beijerinckia TaxID=2638183 RepID=UPI00089762DF|nr:MULTISPECIES: hypothetical protein [unclassified Beijerinckia]MDH7794132.1 hypothetical protein [Beijerinckia sp. GAS462]SEB53993.1 hypothetical protein SAMN05443249_0397 [Beijerinckia sp. 28-YEA-48]